MARSPRKRPCAACPSAPQREVCAIDVHWHDPSTSFVEAVASRGGRAAAAWVESAWRHGARFDTWTEHFSEQAWRDAAVEVGLDPAAVAQTSYDTSYVMPWEHISTGVSTRFWRMSAKKKAAAEKTTPDCTFERCAACGMPEAWASTTSWRSRASPAGRAARPQQAGEESAAAAVAAEQAASGRSAAGPQTAEEGSSMAEQQTFRMRITFAKQGRLALLSHLEVARAIERAVRRAQLPFAVSQGFSPHMKIAFGAALPVGVGGYARDRSTCSFCAICAPRPSFALREERPRPYGEGMRLHRAEGACGFGGVPLSTYRALLSAAPAAAGARAGAYHPQEEGESARCGRFPWWGDAPRGGVADVHLGTEAYGQPSPRQAAGRIP